MILFSLTIIFSIQRHDRESGSAYVIKVKDERTKNHRETNEAIVTGIMRETPDDPNCPVRSFEMYIAHLHPENDCLWQRPNYAMGTDWQDRTPWYTKQIRGKVNINSLHSSTNYLGARFRSHVTLIG
jgi:hypothetical protein